MAYRELVRRWHEGVLAADAERWDAALETFAGIPEPPSRICFDIGCVELLAGRPRQALRAFNRTVEKDNSLAVGYFQRGFVHLQLEMYEEALSDYQMAFNHLRKNPFIDYKQLGLRHILYAWEDCLPLEPMQVPLRELFRPRKKEVEQLASKDFLGKPKVISSIVPDDEYFGFEPLRFQRQGCSHAGADALRDSEESYCRVVSQYCPQGAPGLRAGSLVFVLLRGADGWATAIHDGQKLHIPSSLLEPASTMDPWVTNGLPLPPAQLPPSRLPVDQKPEPAGGEEASANSAGAEGQKQLPPAHGEASASMERPVVLRARCECSLVLRAGQLPPEAELRRLLRERFGQQAERGRLSYRHTDGTELGTLEAQQDPEGLWQQLAEGSLALCCQDSDSPSARPVLYRMLALHPYPAQGPGDLEFSKGDLLDVLSEVNEEWLEGRCKGRTGIFPKCFATQTSCGAASL
ncbi:NADPH oxidase activator 1 isoform X3 [Melanerpes formicivorus]|uniref:NADPH oxidase activator 1 isoform X3 n=1 Tax=Melanerpes formicivorus TaxID=211600 RepID=UPI00358F405D